MKRIKNVISFVTEIIVLILGGVCLCIVAFRGMETRLLIAGIFLLAWSAINFFSAFTKLSIDNQAEKVTDERDKYITMKSSRKALLITNYLISAACFITMFLFAILKWGQLLTVTITLCAVLFLRRTLHLRFEQLCGTARWHRGYCFRQGAGTHRSLPKRKGLVGLSTIPPAVCFPEEL